MNFFEFLFVNLLFLFSNALAALNMHQNMQGLSVNDPNYGGVNALAALTQLSALAAPTFSTPNKSVSNSSNASHHSAVNALTLSQQSTPAAHWKSAQPNIQGNHVQQNHGYINTGYSTSAVNPCDQNGNDDRADNNVSENDHKRKTIPVKKRIPTNPIPATECSIIRPRTQLQRREAGKITAELSVKEILSKLILFVRRLLVSNSKKGNGGVFYLNRKCFTVKN